MNNSPTKGIELYKAVGAYHTKSHFGLRRTITELVTGPEEHPKPITAMSPNVEAFLFCVLEENGKRP